MLITASAIEWGTVPQWIQAVGALALGIGVALLGARQWHREGFLPKAQAWLDSSRGVVGIRISNAGRGKGHLEKLLILHKRWRQNPETWPLTFPGIGTDGTWERQVLDGSDAVVIYAHRSDDEPFPVAKLKVQVWLGGKARITKPVRHDTHTYDGLAAQLPRGTT